MQMVMNTQKIQAQQFHQYQTSNKILKNVLINTNAKFSRMFSSIKLCIIFIDVNFQKLVLKSFDKYCLAASNIPQSCKS